MPQQTDSARPTRIVKISESLEGQKLRVAGRMLSYDGMTGMMLLEDQGTGILVDASLCIDEGAGWTREPKGIVMVIGYIERAENPPPVPVLPAYCISAPDVNAGIVLRGVLVIPAIDLELGVWNGVVDELELELGAGAIGD